MQRSQAVVKQCWKRANVHSMAVYQRRWYSSSCRDNSSDGSSDNKDDKQKLATSSAANENQQQPPQQQQPPPERMSFMPVVNMPEAEFAHNAFFSLHRPLLGLSLDEERPFFSTNTTNRPPNRIQIMLGLAPQEQIEQAEDEALAQYMMNLKPFEPPQSVNTESHHDSDYEDYSNDGTMVTISLDPLDGPIEDIGGMQANSADHMLPMYHMPESDELVDYLTAMQDRLRMAHEQDASGSRRRGANRPRVYAATMEQARKRAMFLQQYRQRTRRQRPIARFQDRKSLK